MFNNVLEKKQVLLDYKKFILKKFHFQNGVNPRLLAKI